LDKIAQRFFSALKNQVFGPSLSRIAGVRDIWLCLGVLCLKSQIPSTKKQTSSKLQAPRQKDGGQAKFQGNSELQAPNIK